MTKTSFALLDRFLISQKELLQRGEVLYVQVNDGYLTINNELDEETGLQKTVTYFSEFDGSLNFSMKELLEQEGNNKE